jgi:ABC-2 type transport system permease protein
MFRRYTLLYGFFLIQRFKILMEYRLNFFIGMFSTVLLQAAGLLGIWVIIGQVPSLNGWTLDQVLMIYGLLTLAKSINHMFADNLWIIGWGYIRPGGFDRFLVRPINPLFHLLADRFCHDGIGNFLVGAALVIISSINLHIVWTPVSLLYLVVVVISGGVIFIALNLVTASSAFWIIESIPVTQVVFNTHEFARFPLTIYPKLIQLLLTILIPYGFASYYPATQILNIEPGVLAWLSPVVAIVLAVISYRVWLFGMKHYGGTGS